MSSVMVRAKNSHKDGDSLRMAKIHLHFSRATIIVFLYRLIVRGLLGATRAIGWKSWKDNVNFSSTRYEGRLTWMALEGGMADMGRR